MLAPKILPFSRYTNHAPLVDCMQNNVYAINQEYGLQFTAFMVISLDHDIDHFEEELLKNKLGWGSKNAHT